jgi:formylglycine-generating enzyme required for sulfatase activity
MKRINILITFAFILFLTVASSQTMQVQTNSGNKSYNIDDVQSITFGKSSSANIEMVEIPAGTFLMGNDSIANSSPVHTVNISRTFYMGKYEVTQKQYTDVMGPPNPSYFKSKDDNPVEQVNWFEAIQFCNELSKREGFEQCYTFDGGTTWHCNFNKKGYRLPTEAEWEYACRAGTSTVYYSGNTETQLSSIAWYENNSSYIPHPVGQKTANKFGLYDMSGNVWEWCWDMYSEYQAGTFDDPTGGTSSTYNMLRGGSWYNYAESCGSAFRYLYVPSYRFWSVGFRVVRTK